MSSLLGIDVDNFLGRNPSVGRINYTDQYIPDTRFDPNKTGPQYVIPEGMVLTPDGTLMSEDAPIGLFGLGRVWAGLKDKAMDDRGLSQLWSSGVNPDYDMRGTRDRLGRLPETGTLGGKPEQIFATKKNVNYDPTKATNPVPNIGSGLSVGKIIQDGYQGWRDRRIADRGAERNMLYNKIANEYAYQLDKAQMYDYMNSPMGMARTNLMSQQAFAVPRIAKAALKEAVAKQQSAANEFGQLGLKRTYFTS
jgi:hypothetical protein